MAGVTQLAIDCGKGSSLHRRSPASHPAAEPWRELTQLAIDGGKASSPHWRSPASHPAAEPWRELTQLAIDCGKGRGCGVNEARRNLNRFSHGAARFAEAGEVKGAGDFFVAHEPTPDVAGS